MSRNSRSSPARRSFTSRAAKQKKKRLPKWRNAWNALCDSLNEHPTFDLEDARESSLEARAPSVALTEAAREQRYCEQWLRVHVLRLRLVAVIGILCMALFIRFYFYIFPHIAREILWFGVLGSGGLAVQIALTFRVRTLWQARLLTLWGFALFSVSSALSLPTVALPAASPDSAVAHTVQFIIATSFAHILLTSLLLPLLLSDTLAISAIVLAALVLGLNSVDISMRAISLTGAVWMVGTVALFITLLAHFNSQLRRRAFDSAFDLGVQALKLKAISETDALTGGFNRRHCERVLKTELARATRFDRPLSLLMFDLDNFKPVNDTLGHAAGDRVLIAVHQAALGELREVDDLSRIGGDEFLVLLPETDQKQMRRIARRLHIRVLRELQMNFGKDSLLGQVTISVGALTLEAGHNFSVDLALERVDELLYDAKSAGKNRVMQSVDDA